MKKLLLVLFSAVLLFSCQPKISERIEKFTVSRGTNIAHWLSQSGARGAELEAFFTKADVDSIAAMGLGCAQGAYEMALAYSKERKQFGHSISKFQAIAFKLADMATKIELTRTLLYKAGWLKDNHLPFAKEAAMSKLYCSEIAKEVTDEAVQIHGGYGLMKDYDIERFYRDQRLLQIGEGTSEIQRLVISRHIGC